MIHHVVLRLITCNKVRDREMTRLKSTVDSLSKKVDELVSELEKEKALMPREEPELVLGMEPAQAHSAVS